MKIQNTKTSQVFLSENTEQGSMKVNTTNIKLLVERLVKDLYSNIYSAFLRELVSNALDAQKVIGVTDPIILTITETEFSVRDFGVGITPEVWEKCYTTLFGSDKDLNESLIGGWGLGCKIPVAISDYFEVHTIIPSPGGLMKYVYSLFDNGSWALKSKEPTTEPRGTEVKVPIDEALFEKLVDNLGCLKYIPNIFYNIQGYEYLNNRKINYLYDHVIVVDEGDKHTGVVLEGIYYPMPSQYMKQSWGKYIELPVVCSYSEGIFPTLSRESINWTPDTIAKVNEKYKRSYEELKLDLNLDNLTFTDYINKEYCGWHYKNFLDMGDIPEWILPTNLELYYKVGHTKFTLYDLNRLLLNNLSYRHLQGNRWYTLASIFDIKEVLGRKPYILPRGFKLSAKTNKYLSSLGKNVEVIKVENEDLEIELLKLLPNYLDIEVNNIPKETRKPKNTKKHLTIYLNKKWRSLDELKTKLLVKQGLDGIPSPYLAVSPPNILFIESISQSQLSVLEKHCKVYEWDEYVFMINHLVKDFLSKEYLKNELSDKRYLKYLPIPEWVKEYVGKSSLYTTSWDWVFKHYMQNDPFHILHNNKLYYVDKLLEKLYEWEATLPMFKYIQDAHAWQHRERVEEYLTHFESKIKPLVL